MILMTPGPTDLHERVLKAMSRPMISHRDVEFSNLYEDTVSKAKSVFQTEKDLFILTCSSTGALDCIAANLIKRGDEVMVPIYGEFCERMANSFEAYGAKVTRLQVHLGSAISSSILKEALDVNPNINIVGLVYNETSTGTIIPDFKKMAEICYDRNILIVLDAVSALAGVNIPVDELKIDVCIVGSQKCIAGPPGLSLISLSGRAWKKIEENSLRPPYFDLILYKKFYDEKRQAPYTPAITLFYGLNEALSIIIEDGLEKWIGKHQDSAKAFYSAFSSMNIETLALDRYRSPTVFALKVPSEINPIELVRKMKDEGVIISKGMGELRGKIIRIASMGNITKHKIVKTVEALSRSLSYLGIRINIDDVIDRTVSILGYSSNLS